MNFAISSKAEQNVNTFEEFYNSFSAKLSTIQQNCAGLLLNKCKNKYMSASQGYTWHPVQPNHHHRAGLLESNHCLHSDPM